MRGNIICKLGRCSTALWRGGMLWNMQNTCPFPECSASVKVGGVPQCSREVKHCGTLGMPALFQNSVEWCRMVWNGMEWACLDNTCHPLSPPVNPRNEKY